MSEILIQRKKKDFLTSTQLIGNFFMICGLWMNVALINGFAGHMENRGKGNVPTVQLTNVSLCLAISSSHIVHHKIIDRAYDRVKFQEFIFEIDALSQERKQFIMDNCRIHYQVDSNFCSLTALSWTQLRPFLANWKIAFGVSCVLLTLKICSKQREVMPSNKNLLVLFITFRIATITFFIGILPASIPIAFRKTIF